MGLNAAQARLSLETLAVLVSASASPRKSPMAAAAAAPLRRLLLRLGKPPPLPIPLLPHITPQTAQAAGDPAAPPCPGAIPSQAPARNLRDVISSFHPGLQIYPSLDPRFGEVEEGVDGEGGGAEVWADSVKKKRKRKMNKHKLRKLRKRLRRQT